MRKPDNLFDAYMDYVRLIDQPPITDEEVEAKANKIVHKVDIGSLMAEIERAVKEAI